MIALNTILEDRLSEPAAPRLQPHHGYRSWTTTWYDTDHRRRLKRFGKEGVVSRQQAKARFQNWFQLEFKRHVHVREFAATEYKVSQLCHDYLEVAKTLYVKNGKLTSHIWQVCYALNDLNNHYGAQPAAALDNPKLAKLRDAMIWTKDAEGKARPRSTKTVNSRLFIIKQAYIWAREQGYVPAETLADLMIVQPLVAGRCAAKSPVPVRPLDETLMRDTMKHTTPVLVAMIEAMWHSGMRPGECCVMRPCDIDTTGEVWLYTPHTHKTEHLGKVRVIALGKRAQKAIKPFLTRDLNAYCFSPAESEQHRRQQQHRTRTTPMSCGNVPGSHRVHDPEWTPTSVYAEQSFRKAIKHACKKAQIDPAWNPNQIRHAWATRVRRQFGIEDASAGLGHTTINTTLIYAEQSLDNATRVARRIG